MLPVTEIFHSIQGEGLNAGRTAWFIRLFGCNLACCGCDEPTHKDSARIEMMDEEAIVAKIEDMPTDLVVITGGEPLLYDLTKLTKLIRRGCVDRTVISGNGDIEVEWKPTFHPYFKSKFASPIICVETNGTCKVSGDLDFICVSPKPLKFARSSSTQYCLDTLAAAHEIKLVVGWTSPEELDSEIEYFAKIKQEACPILLSPLTTFPEGNLIPESAQAAVDCAKRHQDIRISPQWHKWLNIR